MKYLKNIRDSIYSLFLSTEFAYIFGQEIKEHNTDFNFKEVKIASLVYIEELLKKDVIIAVENHGEVKQVGNSIEEIIEVIDVRWTEELGVVVTYDNIIYLQNIVYFHNSKWFINKLKSVGYNFIDNCLEEYVQKFPWLQELLKIDEEQIQRKFQERLLHPPVVSEERKQEIQDKFKEKLSLIRTEPPSSKKYDPKNKEIKQEWNKPPKPTLSKKNFLQRLWHRFITEN